VGCYDEVGEGGAAEVLPRGREQDRARERDNERERGGMSERERERARERERERGSEREREVEREREKEPEIVKKKTHYRHPGAIGTGKRATWLGGWGVWPVDPLPPERKWA